MTIMIHLHRPMAHRLRPSINSINEEDHRTVRKSKLSHTVLHRRRLLVRRPLPVMKSPENEPRDELREAQKLLSLLTDDVEKVEAFKGKWALIGAKLGDLHVQLKALSESPNFSASSLASELVRSVVLTLSDALTLSAKCSNPSPCDGKLRTQSDVDSASARLDQHVGDLGLLTRSLGDCSDSVNSVLLTRLQIGDFASRNSAMDSLLCFLQEDDRNSSTVVNDGFVPVLVGLLDSSSVEIKEKAVSAISRISTFHGCENSLISQCPVLITHLLRILDSRNGFAREKACIALQALTSSEENAKAIGFGNGVASLLEVCQTGTLYSQAYATRVLRNISRFTETRRFFLEENLNATQVLIAIAGSGSFIAQANSLGCLNNLVSDNETLNLEVAKEGVIGCLKSFWDSAPIVQSVEVAVHLLKSLASCESIAEAIVAEGFLAKLRGTLNCGVASVRLASAEAICELGFSSKTRKEIGELGIIASLVSMLDAKSGEEKEMAAKALSILLLQTSNRKIFLREENAIDRIVQLLDPSMKNVEKTVLISILSSVVHSSKLGQKKVIDSRAPDHLGKLVEMGIDGAKKLLESLKRGKTGWSVFSRRN